MHRPHGDIHDEGLFDDCLGCAELAENAIREGDAGMLTRWIEAATAQPRSFDKSENELIAIKNVLNVLEQAGHLIATHPAAIEKYLVRWGTTATFA